MIDAEWSELQQSWRAGGGQKRARQLRDRARRAMAFDAAFAVFWICLAAWFSLRKPERWVLVWAATVTVLFAMTLVYAVWNRRDALWPSSQTPLDFLAQAELRCRRQLQMLRFIVQFGAVEVAISLALYWFAWRQMVPIAAAMLALVCGGGLLWVGRARRRAVRELKEIVRLRGELERGE